MTLSLSPSSPLGTPSCHADPGLAPYPPRHLPLEIGGLLHSWITGSPSLCSPVTSMAAAAQCVTFPLPVPWAQSDYNPQIFPHLWEQSFLSPSQSLRREEAQATTTGSSSLPLCPLIHPQGWGGCWGWWHPHCSPPVLLARGSGACLGMLGF